MNDTDAIVQLALAEDIGTGDVSASLLDNQSISAHIIAKQPAIVCGINYVNRSFALVDETSRIDWQVQDGDGVSNNQVLCTIQGNNRSILSGERVALNFLQTLSAVATQTHRLVTQIAHTQAQLLDTRKTLPGLRRAQKQAVSCGGGTNHRLGLYDCVLLKENHIQLFGSVQWAIQQAKKKQPLLPIIVEVEDLRQLDVALNTSGLARILCDNFSIEDLRSAVLMARGQYPLEASGNIGQHNLVAIAETGVDYISLGAITKNIQAIDYSLLIA